MGSKRSIGEGVTAVARRVEFLAVCERPDVVHGHGITLLGVVGAIARLTHVRTRGHWGWWSYLCGFVSDAHFGFNRVWFGEVC
jgi:hypothetical protein